MDAPNTETTKSDQIDDAQTSNGINIIDIPMPSVNESQSDTATSENYYGNTASNNNSNTNSIEPSPGETGIKAQNDVQRQFNLISVPPPPPPAEHEPKSTLSSNIVISTQRTVNIYERYFV